MQSRIFLAFLVLISISSCKKDVNENTIQETDLVQKQEIERFEFGFNLNNYIVVRDTIRKGDSFGEILERNKIGYPKIFHIAERQIQWINSLIPDTEAANVAIAQSSGEDDMHSFSSSSEKSLSRNVPRTPNVSSVSTTPSDSYTEDSFVAGDDEEILYEPEESPEKEKAQKRKKRKRPTDSPQLRGRKKMAKRAPQQGARQLKGKGKGKGKKRRRARGRQLAPHKPIVQPEQEPEARPKRRQHLAAKSPTQSGSVRDTTEKHKRFSFTSYTPRRKD